MTRDQVAGKVEHAMGHVRQAIGEAIGSQKLANQGIAEQVKGAARETWGNVKDAATVSADRHEREAQQSANAVRANVSTRIDEFQNKLNEKIDAHKTKDRLRERSA
jgi:uncharacterized protein YjbJ (UPF0337 family)